MTYALGRRLSFIDRDEIQQITRSVSNGKLGLRDLIHQVVKSKAFQSK